MTFGLLLLLFPLVTFGLAWPLAGRLALDPGEKLCAAAVLSLLGVYLTAGAIYLLGLPVATFWVLPVAAVLGLAAGRRALAATFGDPLARAVLAGQALISAWCLGWLALVIAYSGGGWTSDWFEHWERTRFFLEHWAPDAKLLGIYALPARPPLLNLVTGAFLGVTAVEFPLYQVVTTLLNCLVFLPAALLARRFTSREGSGVMAAALLTVLLMVNPSFVENATFAWTKLAAAFFILSGLYFFLRAREAGAPAAAGPLCAASLAAGVLAHYSAGPYVLLLAAAWFGLDRGRWRDPAFWRQTLRLGLLGSLLLATWFGWSFLVYGTHTTLLSNSSVAMHKPEPYSPLLKVALNLRDTLVPHFLRNVDPQLITQPSPSAWLRDWFFQLYQVNLLFAFGSVAWLVLAVRLVRDWNGAQPSARRFWLGFAGGVILLGVAVHGARDHWGLAHICLQSLVVLGLAALAARWPDLGRGWQRVLVAGAAFDFLAGIALQFAVQAFAVDRWLDPGQPLLAVIKGYSESALMNLAGKMVNHVRFLADVLPVSSTLVLALLAVILTLALVRAARAVRPPA